MIMTMTIITMIMMWANPPIPDSLAARCFQNHCDDSKIIIAGFFFFSNVMIMIIIDGQALFFII